MHVRSFYKYHHKNYELDILEEILKRRSRFTRDKNTYFYTRTTVKSNVASENSLTRNIYSTVFKSIAYRKSQKSLFTATNYILKNADHLENEFGELVNKSNLANEIARFNLIDDRANLKTSFTGNDKIKDINLKNRQIWHSMFSLPNNKKENLEPFKEALREALADLLPGYKFMFAIHTNTKYMHCHLVVKTKNELTKKQIRINPTQLQEFHEHINQKCLDHGVDIAKYQNKEIDLPKKPRLSTSYNKVKNWKQMYLSDNFTELKVNPEIHKKLSDLGMNSKSINSFLNMYIENKALAIWTVNNNSKIFSISKPTNFTLRKVKITRNLSLNQVPLKQVPLNQTIAHEK